MLYQEAKPTQFNEKCNPDTNRA